MFCYQNTQSYKTFFSLFCRSSSTASCEIQNNGTTTDSSDLRRSSAFLRKLTQQVHYNILLRQTHITWMQFNTKPRCRCRRECGPDPKPDEFQNLMRTSLSKDTSLIIFSWRSDQFYPEIWTTLWKRCSVKESFKKFQTEIPRCRWLPKFNKFLLVHRYIPEKFWWRSNP